MKFGNVSLPPAVVEILIIVSVLIVASILLALYLLSRSGPSKNKNPDPQHPLAKKKQAHKKRPRSRRVSQYRPAVLVGRVSVDTRVKEVRPYQGIGLTPCHSQNRTNIPMQTIFMLQNSKSTNKSPLPERQGRLPWPMAISSEPLIVLVSVVFVALYNGRFWAAALNGREWDQGSMWLFGAALFAMLTAAHALLLALLITRRTAKPLLAVLFIVTALAVYYMQRYTVFFDMSMMRNILHTDIKEARELLSLDMLLFVVLYGVLPAVVVSRVTIAHRSWRRALVIRSLFLAGMLGVGIASLALVFQDFSALMRNHREVRYLITPANYMVGLVRVLAAETASAQKKRIPIGLDAALDPSAPEKSKPTLLVLVVGETVRAANWGLNGYARQTTPRLAQQDVINFPRVTSCGTNTEVSLPCMFSPFGRKDYDEKAIHEHESLLHVLERAEFHISWRDNQSGCKGVCEGLEQQRLGSSAHATLCDGERCLDEILLEGLDAEIQHANGNVVIVLHQLGNHGPAYYRRYPLAFRQFMPTCDTGDLGKCTREQIVNSYDNALLYTDYFLSQSIEKLKQQTTHNAAMLYVGSVPAEGEMTP
ncbi:phosphoethanolamine transferase [Enterobacter sp. SECR18-0236]|uniref:phosphoethanolamine transferase n=1 Tax=Enterobacterales TaxID=91347 RepID=UPI0015B64FE8|nr:MULTISPECIES: phosphoethanolamine transferase domain-containing protein [Enterobacterales]MBH0128408.1 phosphoethanolamine transferase [Enterobacter sp. SECR18-0236]MDX7542978.1 phosphoethanolamine transferase domain-containing protein [Serratia marcescens]